MDLISIRERLMKGESVYVLPLKVAYYARVSTDKEDQQNSLLNQTSYYEHLIRKNESWIFSGGYVDEGISGTGVEKRNQFKKMISDAEKGKFDLIITKEISRFSRNTLDSLQYTRRLLDAGVGVYFQSDQINTLLPDAELRLAILSSIAQDEVRKLSERVRFGFQRACENGVILGNDNLFGYEKKKGMLQIIPREAEIVRDIFTRYTQEGVGIRRIAKDLNEKGILSKTGGKFCYATVYGILKNPKYKGYYAGAKTTTLDYRSKKKIRKKEEEWLVRQDEKIPAIVSAEIWDQANRILKERGKRVKEKGICFQNRYSYSGKILCGVHKEAFHRITVGKEKKEAWFCREYRLKGKEKGCGGPFFYTSEVDEVMEAVWRKTKIDQQKVLSILNRLQREIEEKNCEPVKSVLLLDKEIKSFELKKEKLLELYVSGLVSGNEFHNRNEKYNASVRFLETEKEKQKEKADSDEESRKWIEEFENKLNRFEFRRDWLNEWNRALLDHIEVTGTREKPELKIFLAGSRVFRAQFAKDGILLWEMGISQAQVSRLEKNALQMIRKEM